METDSQSTGRSRPTANVNNKFERAGCRRRFKSVLDPRHLHRAPREAGLTYARPAFSLAALYTSLTRTRRFTVESFC